MGKPKASTAAEAEGVAADREVVAAETGGEAPEPMPEPDSPALEPAPEPTAPAEDPDPEPAAPAADQDALYVIRFDVVGPEPSFTKGEFVPGSELAHLGIERLVEIGAIAPVEPAAADEA